MDDQDKILRMSEIHAFVRPSDKQMEQLQNDIEELGNSEEFENSINLQFSLYIEMMAKLGSTNLNDLPSLKSIVYSLNIVVKSTSGVGRSPFITACLYMGWLHTNSEDTAKKISEFANTLVNSFDHLVDNILPAIQSLEMIRMYSESHKSTNGALLHVMQFIQGSTQKKLDSKIPEAIKTIGVDISFAFAVYTVELKKLHQVSQFLSFVA